MKKNPLKERAWSLTSAGPGTLPRQRRLEPAVEPVSGHCAQDLLSQPPPVENSGHNLPDHDTRSEQALRRSELRYRRFFETAKDGILILDEDTGRINDVNPFLLNLLGFSLSEMVGKTVGELSPFKDIESN